MRRARPALPRNSSAVTLTNTRHVSSKPIAPLTARARAGSGPSHVLRLCRRAGAGARAHLRREVGFEVVEEPAETADERARVDAFEVVGRFDPVKPAAGGRQYCGGFTDAAGQIRMVDAVDRGLLAVGHHDLVAKDIDRLEAEEFAGGLRDDPDARLPEFSFAQTGGRDEEDDAAVLRRQPVVGGGSAEADVVALDDAAGEREEIAVPDGVGALVGWYEEILSPGCPFQPALAAQRLDDVVGGLGASAEHANDLRARRFALVMLREGQDDPALLGR